MIINIGILAWNEERNIVRTLNSLLDQTVFAKPNSDQKEYKWEIIVVPNGCRDATADIARRILSERVAQLIDVDIRFDVIEVAEAGKSNAWNRYVHDFSDKNADYIILIDADIQFRERETISNVLNTFQVNESAKVVVDLPIKDIANRERKNILEWLSVRFSKINLDGPVGICGQFYCARGEVLRSIWMPIGLSGEDGFLKSMVVTDLFRRDVDERRVVRAPNASHYYAAETNLVSIFKHQARLVIGTSLNCYLNWDALKFLTDPSGPGAGVLIRNQVENDPDWYRKFMNNSIANKGWWVLPRGMVLRRFSSTKDLTGFMKLRRIFLLVIRLLFDIPVFIYANNKIKSGKAIGYW